MKSPICITIQNALTCTEWLLIGNVVYLLYGLVCVSFRKLLFTAFLFCMYSIDITQVTLGGWALDLRTPVDIDYSPETLLLWTLGIDHSYLSCVGYTLC